MKKIEIVLLVIICYGIFFVLSGHKENFQLISSKLKHKKLQHTELKWNEKEKKEDCRPVLKCRRVGFYCSVIN
jgi:hypothetical protein